MLKLGNVDAELFLLPCYRDEENQIVSVFDCSVHIVGALNKRAESDGYRSRLHYLICNMEDSFQCDVYRPVDDQYIESYFHLLVVDNLFFFEVRFEVCCHFV